MPVTIKDIAKAARVSHSTVSRALNNDRRVKPETRERILQVARRLNYQPNDVARSLVTRQTNTIGIIIPEVMTSFYAEILQGIEKVANENGYSIILGVSGFDPVKEREYINLFKRKQVDGMILASTCPDNFPELWELKRERLPFLIVDAYVGDATFITLSVDNLFGVMLAMNHLIEMGHRRIAYIADRFTTSQRLAAYRLALETSGIQLDQELIRISDNRGEAGGYEAMTQLLELDPPPTAAFASNDVMAVGAIAAVRHKGMKVPDDVSVVGFDDMRISSFLEVPLTTVAQPKQEMGERAAQILIDWIKSGNGEPEPQHILFKPRLVVRSSVKPLQPSATTV